MAECYLRPVNALVDIMAGVVSIWFSYKFMTSESFKNLDKCLSIMTIIFFILTVDAFICWAIFSAFYCIYPSIITIPRSLGMASFVLQYITLIAMLWHRLCFVFDGSPFSVSIRTKNIFWIMYIIQIALALAALLVSTGFIDGILGVIIPTTALLCVMCLVSTLIGMFAYKLMIVSRRIPNVNKDKIQLQSMGTKLFILTLASFISCLVTLIATFVIRIADDNMYLASVYKSVLSVDAMTNHLSIVLGATSFNKYYMRLCGCCQSKCVQCWTKQTNKTDTRLSDLHQNDQVVNVKSTSDDLAQISV